MLVAGCGSSGPDPHPEAELSVAELVLSRSPDGEPLLFERVSAPSRRFTRLGQALLVHLGYGLPSELPDPEGGLLTDPRPPMSFGGRVRVEAESLLIDLELYGSTPTARGRARAQMLIETGARQLPELLKSDDGQYALAFLGELKRRRGITDSDPLSREACRLAREFHGRVDRTRQVAALRLFGSCRDTEVLLVGETRPDSPSGCGLLAASNPSIPAGWVNRCWRSIVQFSLDGRDERALSEALLLATNGTLPESAQLRRYLSQSAGRAAQFGGGLSPFVRRSAAAHIAAAEGGRAVLRGAAVPEVPTAGGDVRLATDDDVVQLGVLGMAGMRPADGLRAIRNARALREASTWRAIEARRLSHCIGLTADWNTGLQRPSSIAPRFVERYTDVVVERQASCTNGYSSRSTARRRLADLRSRVLSAYRGFPKAIRTTDEAERIHALEVRLCLLGLPETAWMRRWSIDTHTLGPVFGDEYVSRSFAAAYALSKYPRPCMSP